MGGIHKNVTFLHVFCLNEIFDYFSCVHIYEEDQQ